MTMRLATQPRASMESSLTKDLTPLSCTQPRISINNSNSKFSSGYEDCSFLSEQVRCFDSHFGLALRLRRRGGFSNARLRDEIQCERSCRHQRQYSGG